MDSHFLTNVVDIGCGNRPKGDVNVDLYPENGYHRDIIVPIEGVKKISNFVKADVLNLPFRDKTFNMAYSSHVIEHTESPLLFVREMQRIAKKIKICAPLGKTQEWLWFRVHGHKWSLMPWWYRNIIPNSKVRISLEFRRIVVRGRVVPLFRYPYWGIVCESGLR